MREQILKTRLNDYGHEFHWKLTEPDGSIYVIPGGATITFEAYLDEGSSLLVNDSTNTAIVDADDGHVKYTTQTGSPSAAGIYWCRMKINNITSEEAKWIVVGEYSGGE